MDRIPTKSVAPVWNVSVILLFPHRSRKNTFDSAVIGLEKCNSETE
ncbi:MAG: hypothetical protein QOK90_00010 [Nitrososphaeraceae archaeon]|nr:hypothetical protein [Nitrososphaeraceae archaeon]